MRHDRELPPLTHRQPPRDYVPTARPARAPLTGEQKLVLGLLICITVAGCALIWIGVR
jgi:hypothetical protein